MRFWGQKKSHFTNFPDDGAVINWIYEKFIFLIESPKSFTIFNENVQMITLIPHGMAAILSSGATYKQNFAYIFGVVR